MLRHGSLDAGKELASVERLLDEVGCAVLHGGDRHLDLRDGGDQDEGSGDSALLEVIEARNPWHEDVGYDAFRPHAAIEVGEQRFRRGKARGRDVVARQIELEAFEHGRIIVDQRDVERLSHGRTTGGERMGATGRVKCMVAPGVPASSRMRPPLASMSDRHSESPTPSPSCLVEDSGRNGLATRSGGKPGPESRPLTTTKSASLSAASIAIVRCPASLMASIELRMRLSRTCSICSTSTITGGSPTATDCWIFTPARSRSGRHRATVSRTMRSTRQAVRLLRS